MKGIAAAFAGLIVMACSGCGGGGGGSQTSQANQAVENCYVQNPNIGKPCILDDAAIQRGIVHASDDPRLKEVLAKFEAGGFHQIGFIGGSITAGAWASDADHRYVNLVFAYLQKRFPKSQFALLNAGVGGTDSHYGDQRLQNDLLRFTPDLVITEWANNDGVQGYAGVLHDYGDVVDRIMGLPNRPAVIMLIGMDRNGNNADTLEFPVGYSRNITMLSTKAAILAQQQRGDFTGEQRTSDPVHPNDLGHQILAVLVEKYLDAQNP